MTTSTTRNDISISNIHPINIATLLERQYECTETYCNAVRALHHRLHHNDDGSNNHRHHDHHHNNNIHENSRNISTISNDIRTYGQRPLPSSNRMTLLIAAYQNYHRATVQLQGIQQQLEHRLNGMSSQQQQHDDHEYANGDYFNDIFQQHVAQSRRILTTIWTEAANGIHPHGILRCDIPAANNLDDDVDIDVFERDHPVDNDRSNEDIMLLGLVALRASIHRVLQIPI